MQKNNSIFLMTLFLTLSTLAACTGNSKSEEPKELVEFDTISVLDGVKCDYENTIFDGFTDGIDKDIWYIGNQAWGAGNGGVIPENVFYTDDGYCVLRSNGNFYAKEEVAGVGNLKDGRNTGSVLISKFFARPGRYSSRFIPVCRQGACTAMWTYAYRQNESGAPDNHEIDIELPGGSSTGTINFKNCLFTNWQTESNKMSQDNNMAEATHGKTINLNDGKFHEFGFDWYTDPEMIVYHIDGYITAINTGFVPSIQGRLWLGNWFPKQGSFVGVSDFETEYMVVDWFKYIPFLDQPFIDYTPTQGGVASDSQYPTSPISLPKANWIANGDFEYYVKKGQINNYGWSYSHLLTKPKDKISVDATIALGEGTEDSTAAMVKANAYLYASVDSVYEGYQYNLSFDYRSEIDGLTCYLTFLNVTEGTVEERRIELPAKESYEKYSVDFTVPKDSYNFKIEFLNEDADLVNTAYIDNVSMVRK